MPGFSNAERLSFYAHVRTLESDFDKSQSQLRTIAAAWSGGVIGAVALTSVAIATTGLSTSQPDPDAVKSAKELLFYVRELVCVVGSLGIFVFWYVDQSVYQRLLHSTFAYGLNLEQQNPDLPQMRSSLYWANLDVTGRLGSFYRMQFWAFVVLAGMFILLPHEPLSHIPFDSLVLLFVFYALFAFILEMRSWEWAALDKTIKRLYPDTLYDALPRDSATEGAGLARVRTHQVPLDPTAAAKTAISQAGAPASTAPLLPAKGGRAS